MSLIDLAKYHRRTIVENQHVIKIWTPKNSSENISKITEINSVYHIDTIDDGARFKTTVSYNDYYVRLKDSTKNVWYETIDGQGLNKYSIGTREVLVQREMILAGLFYIDHSKDLKQLTFPDTTFISHRRLKSLIMPFTSIMTAGISIIDGGRILAFNFADAIPNPTISLFRNFSALVRFREIFNSRHGYPGTGVHFLDTGRATICIHRATGVIIRIQ